MTDTELRELVATLVADEVGKRVARSSETPVAAGEVLSAAQVANFLGVRLNTVYEYANRGAIPHQRLGRRMLFSRAALVAWLGACKSETARKG